MVHHNVHLVNNFGKKLSRSFYNYPESIISKRYLTLYLSVVIGHTVSMNKNFLDLLTSFDGEDIIMHDWWLSIIADINNCRYYLDSKLGFYRIHSNNIYGLNNSGFNIFKKIRFFFSNCKSINKQREKILTEIKHEDQFLNI